MAPDGSFVVTWESYGEGSVASAKTVNYAIYAREYAPNGTPVTNSTFQPNGNEFQVSTPSPYARTTPDVSMDAADDFVIVWSGDFQAQSTWGVYGDYFFGATGKTTGEVLLSTAPNQRGTFTSVTTFDLSNTGPRVGMASSTGNFVVTWANYNSATTTGFNIYARQFAPGCVPLAGTPSAAGAFQVNEPPALLQPNLNPATIGWQLMPAVGVDASGNFTIVWTSYGQDNAEVNKPNILDYGVYARMYLANGADFFDTDLGTFPLEYRVNATTLGNQTAPAVNRGDAAGDSDIAWVGPDTQAVGTTAIYFRVVDPPAAAPAVKNASVAPMPKINVANATVSVGSAAGKETFTVTLSKASTKQVSVGYSTADGTAKAGTDYTAAFGTLTFAPGQTSKTITVNVAAMKTAGQANKTFQLNFKTAINGTLAQNSATGTIVDGLTAAILPTITSNPVSQTVAAGASVTFSSTAIGATSEQWQVSTNGGTTFTNIAGATAATYKVTATASMSGYKYRVMYTNAIGSVLTSPATLTVGAGTVNSLPTITSNPVSQTVAAGVSITFSSTAVGATSEQWQVSTNGGTTFTNIAGATAATYTVTAAASMSGYNYRVAYTNAAGTVLTSPATLTVGTGTVNSLPAITSNPVSKAVAANSQATFTAAASGTPAPTVQWQVSSNGATWTNIVGATSTSYSVTATAANSGTQYHAVFTNSVGTATTTAATLTVNSLPTITSNPVSQTVASGASASFSSTAVGATSEQWQASTDGGTTFTNIAGATSATYTVTAAASMSGYKYRVAYTNAARTVAYI